MGTHGVRLFYRNYINLCAQPFDGTNCVRQFPDLGQVDIKKDIGTSTFNAGQFSLERQMKHGWMWEVQYMLSHSINQGSVGGGEANAPENANCIRCDLGPSVFDTRHNFTATGIYELPFGPGRRLASSSGGFLGKILEGWSLNGIGLFHTGHPLTPLMGLDGTQIPDGNARADQRPDLVPGVSVVPAHQSRNNWININAFAVPPMDANGVITHFGNSPRGIIRAPNVWQTDLALTKSTKLTERVKLEFRAEAFNVFNHKLTLGSAFVAFQLGNKDALGRIRTSVGHKDCQQPASRIRVVARDAWIGETSKLKSVQQVGRTYEESGIFFIKVAERGLLRAGGKPRRAKETMSPQDFWFIQGDRKMEEVIC
jgi:hypothetical protein